MQKYVLKKRNKNKSIKKIEDYEGYVLKPNLKKENMIKVSRLEIQNEEMIQLLLSKKIESNFRKLTAIILRVLEDHEASGGDIALALNELAKEKSILLKEYKKFIQKNEYDKYVRRLKLYEKKLKEKLVYIEEKNLENTEEESMKR